MTTFVAVSDPHVAVMGRVERPEPGRIRFGYPGVTLRVRFEGESLAMRVSAETPNSHLAVFVDGGEARVVRLPQGPSDVVLAEGLGPGAHTVDVVHRTETWMSVVNVTGFRLAPGGRLLDPAPWPTRRMLFVGDSVTCGERIDRQPGETEPFASSNGYLSYGMRLARALDAQCHLVCYGGRGLVRDWQGRTDVLTGPQLFDLAVADETGGPPWDHAAYTPDVVFVSLGTNDFSLAIGPLPERETFVSAYVDLRAQGPLPLPRRARLPDRRRDGQRRGRPEASPEDDPPRVPRGDGPASRRRPRPRRPLTALPGRRAERPPDRRAARLHGARLRAGDPAGHGLDRGAGGGRPGRPGASPPARLEERLRRGAARHHPARREHAVAHPLARRRRGATHRIDGELRTTRDGRDEAPGASVPETSRPRRTRRSPSPTASTTSARPPSRSSTSSS